MTTATAILTAYEAKKFPHLEKLARIPASEMTEHLKLYNGYVTNCNNLREKIAQLVEGERAFTPEFAELTRRLGFEYNGMRLHELYFGNLGGGQPSSILKGLIEEAFGTWANWEVEFRAIASMRGVGWAILYRDPETGFLSNHWIGLHEEGHPAGFTPLLVLDVWEHAWTGYLKPTERVRYLDDFFASVDWGAVERRLPR